MKNSPKNKIEHEQYCLVIRVQSKEDLEEFAQIIGKPEWNIKTKKRKVIRYSDLKKNIDNPFEAFVED